MLTSDGLPILESKFDQVLEQLRILERDVESKRLDAGVVVMVDEGRVDVRGLGETTTLSSAFAILYMAMRSMPPLTQQQIADELNVTMMRSERIAKEVPLWRDSTTSNTCQEAATQ